MVGVTEELNALLPIRVESLSVPRGWVRVRVRVQTEGDLVVLFLPLEPQHPQCTQLQKVEEASPMGQW